MNNKVKTLMAALTALLMLVVLPACTDDKDDFPGQYGGTISSSIPAVPSFEPQSQADNAVLAWSEKGKTATLALGGFKVNIGQMGRDIVIGDMYITGITCAPDGKGGYMLSHNSFSCQAGDYAINDGKLYGTYSGDGSLDITLEYKPGSMPMVVKSVFAGQRGQQ